MNEIKKAQVPSLYDELSNRPALKILRKNKNDYVPKKTVWRVASLSFIIGGLCALALYWGWLWRSDNAVSDYTVLNNTAINNTATHSPNINNTAINHATNAASLTHATGTKTTGATKAIDNSAPDLGQDQLKPTPSGLPPTPVATHITAQPATSLQTHTEASPLSGKGHNPFNGLEASVTASAVPASKPAVQDNTQRPAHHKAQPEHHQKKQQSQKHAHTQPPTAKAANPRKETTLAKKSSPKQRAEKINAQTAVTKQATSKKANINPAKKPDRIEQLIIKLNKKAASKNKASQTSGQAKPKAQSAHTAKPTRTH